MKTNSAARIPTTLFGLLTHYSPSGSEAGAVHSLIARMGDLAFDRTLIDQAGNAVGIMGTGDRQLVLLGHIDTVPGEIDVRLEGDLLYGRGAVDAKGPLSAFVDAAAVAGRIPGWQIIVIGAVDEERGSRGARFVAGEYRPAYAIIGEPSGWDRLTLGYKGYAGVQITVRRPSAHDSSNAEKPGERLVNIWLAIKSQADGVNEGKTRPFDQLSPSLVALSSAGDGLENWASMKVVARLPVGVTAEAWINSLGEVVADDELVPLGSSVPPYQAEKNTPLVRAFLRGVRAAGGDPRFVLKTGTADLNLVAPVWGCPAVAYGPGDSALDHTPDEHISLAEYQRSVAVLVDVLRDITGT